MTVLTFLERVAALAPLVEAHRDETEKARRLPEPLFTALRDAGLFGLWVPRDLRGAEVDLQAAVRVVEEVSRLDGSVGWNVMIAANTAILWGCIEPGVAAAMVSEGSDAVLAGTITSGSGTAVPVPGGYRVTGNWPFASGCHQAGWLVAICTVTGVDGTDARSAPAATRATFALPAKTCEILDTWHTVGMRGTGSHDFRATGVFVPEEHRLAPLGAGLQGGPLYKASLLHLWPPMIAGVAIGIARDALDTFAALAKTKKAALTTAVLADREVVQDRFGRAEAALRAGRALLYETVRETWARILAGEDLSDETTTLTRLAAATAVEHAIVAVDSAFELAGSTSIFEKCRLERCFRDIHVIRQHAVVGPSGFAVAGRAFLGGKAPH